MKYSAHCPKCSSVDLIMIEGNGMNQNQIVSLTKWGTSSAIIDRYICGSCGYTEEYVKMTDKFEKWVAKNRRKGNFGSDFV